MRLLFGPFCWRSPPSPPSAPGSKSPCRPCAKRRQISQLPPPNTEWCCGGTGTGKWRKATSSATWMSSTPTASLNVIIWAYYGLEIDYLSDTWFQRVQFAVEAARDRGMRVWIADEGSYPSGFAGGAITNQYPQDRMKALVAVSSVTASGGIPVAVNVSAQDLAAWATETSSGTVVTLQIVNGKINWTPPPAAGRSRWSSGSIAPRRPAMWAAPASPRIPSTRCSTSSTPTTPASSWPSYTSATRASSATSSARR